MICWHCWWLLLHPLRLLCSPYVLFILSVSLAVGVWACLPCYAFCLCCSGLCGLCGVKPCYLVCCCNFCALAAMANSCLLAAHGLLSMGPHPLHPCHIANKQLQLHAHAWLLVCMQRRSAGVLALVCVVFRVWLCMQRSVCRC